MKVCIINLQWFDNPGAVWLAYSLQETVKRIIGSDNIEIMDYAAGGGRKHRSNLNLFEFSGKVKNKMQKITSPDYHKFCKKTLLRHELYEKFRHDYLKRTQRFSTLNSSILNKEYTHFIVGSDVVWKPEIADSMHSLVYFLKFAKKESVKISYAASIGTDDATLLNPLATLYSRLISDFDYISVREKSAADFLEKISDKNITQVIDPVFLSEAKVYKQFLKDCVDISEKPYLFLYLLTPDERAVNFALRIAEENNLVLVYDLHKTENLGIRKMLSSEGKVQVIECIEIGPVEFLKSIYGADFVVSDSFHGTSFSILFHKNFYTFGRVNRGINISSRVENLLRELGLSEQFIGENISEDIRFTNYQGVDDKINLMKEASIEFLKSSLT